MLAYYLKRPLSGFFIPLIESIIFCTLNVKQKQAFLTHFSHNFHTFHASNPLYMKILHKILILGVFLLMSTNSFGQNKTIDTERPISIVNESISASAVIEFHFSNSKNIDMKVYDINKVMVLEASWEKVQETFKKVDFSLLKSGIYFIHFFDQENLIFKKEISKI